MPLVNVLRNVELEKKTRTVKCKRGTKEVSDNQCTQPKPLEKVNCNTEACPKWVSGAFGECSKKCGTGEKTRTVKCKRGTKEVSEEMCTKPKPLTEEKCNTQKCPGWVSGDFGECSKKCGGGEKTRTVKCKRGTKEVSDDQCIQPKPLEKENCNTEACPKWVSGKYGECSKKCGGGIRKRTVQCKRGNVTVDDNNCTETKPANQEYCNNQDCWNKLKSSYCVGKNIWAGIKTLENCKQQCSRSDSCKAIRYYNKYCQGEGKNKKCWCGLFIGNKCNNIVTKNNYPFDSYLKPKNSYKKVLGKACFGEKGDYRYIGKKTLDQCKEKCNQNKNCQAINISKYGCSGQNENKQCNCLMYLGEKSNKNCDEKIINSWLYNLYKKNEWITVPNRWCYGFGLYSRKNRHNESYTRNRCMNDKNCKGYFYYPPFGYYYFKGTCDKNRSYYKKNATLHIKSDL